MIMLNDIFLDTLRIIQVFLTRCLSGAKCFYNALRFATFYASTVTLLPTHCPETNAIIARNRRIGVSLSGLADYLDMVGAAHLTRQLRNGYDYVETVNKELAAEAGIPPSVRLTTVKPSGTISLLAGTSSGLHFPTFRYAIRRMRVGKTSPVCDVLINSGVPYETDVMDEGTYVFEFPIQQKNTRPATEVSAWEQFSFLAMMQREWSDNMVSCTVYFDKEKEGHQVDKMLAQFAPVIKSVSMLPHSKNGAYAQMPYEGISKSEYKKRKKALNKIDWSTFGGSDGRESRFCTNDTCDL